MDKKYKVVKVEDAEKLKEFYNTSALTLLGLDLKSLDDYIDFLDENGSLKKPFDVYVYTGGLMNSAYNLTGTNAYQDNLTIVTVENSSFENFGNMCIARLQIEDLKWFDDIVDNNARG